MAERTEEQKERAIATALRTVQGRNEIGQTIGFYHCGRYKPHQMQEHLVELVK